MSDKPEFRLSWADRALMAIAPRAARRRVGERMRIDMMQRAYAAADLGRRSGGWNPTNTSANAEIVPNAPRIRANVRDLLRNDPMCSKAVGDTVATAVGIGIAVKWKNPKTQAAWDNWWRDEADADGDLTGPAMEALWWRAWIESGDVLVRFRPRQASDGLSVPLQLQTFEPDHLDTGKTLAGARVISGIQFDALGRRVAYWMTPDHPSDLQTLIRGRADSRAVPAASIVHLYLKQRAPQVVGVPMIHAAVAYLREIGDIRAALLMKKKIEACFAVFVETDDDDTLGSQTVAQTASARQPAEETVRPGMVRYFKPGQRASFAQPTTSGGDAEWLRSIMGLAAAGLNSTYSRATGDLRQANFSSLRAGDVGFRALIEQCQWLFFIPFLRRIATEWARVAFYAGAIDEAGAKPVDFVPPPVRYLDPTKEVAAEKEELRGGLKLLADSLRERGYDVEQFLAEAAEMQRRLKELGLSFDTIGALATAPPSAPAPDDEKENDDGDDDSDANGDNAGKSGASAD